MLLELANGESVSRGELPVLGVGEFVEAVSSSVAGGARIASLFACGEQLVAVLADDAGGLLGITTARIEARRYAALTPHCSAAHWFEREIAEQAGIVPFGHPWLKPIRFEPRAAEPSLPGVVDFYRVEGDGVHEVAVGPVHAGIIEPGHFRFQCAGETVLHLEIELGYQHRGVERALRGGPDRRSIHYAETLAGDTTIGHATAYASCLEALGGVEPPPRAQAIRGLALELERLANHAGDLGALAGDVAFQPTAAACGRLRGELLNLTALLCGDRFGRGLVRPGGVAFDLEPARAQELASRLAETMGELERPVGLLWDRPSVLARFEDTGAITRAQALEDGLVGPPARATGLERDVRYTHPAGVFRFAQVPVSTWTTGDVFARAYLRWLEMKRSTAFIARCLETLPRGPIRGARPDPAPDRLAVALVEGWRGEICHVALTGPDGRFAHYKVTDPSFHNWFGLAGAMRGQPISDFPLCNKSFNLSYCGHDL